MFSSNNFKATTKSLILLSFVELCERFSYYGIRSLLVLFLTLDCGYKDAEAGIIYSLFSAVCYILPLFSGLLADKLTGFRNMIILGGIIIVAGHICLALIALETKLIYLGLGLVAVGTGMFKGNVVNLLSSCYRENDSAQRGRHFALLYIGLNLGTLSARIVCGYTAYLYGQHYGLTIAGSGMLLGVVTFIKFEHLLGNSGLPPHPQLMHKSILGVNVFTLLLIGGCIAAFAIAEILRLSELFVHSISFLGFLVLLLFLIVFFFTTLKRVALEKKKLIALLILAGFQMCVFALLMQLGSLITLFTQRNVVNVIGHYIVPPTTFQLLNPIIIIIFGMLSHLSIWPKKRYIVIKFACSIFMMAICFFILYVGCLDANMLGKVNYLYLIVAIALMAVVELNIAPTVNEQTTLLAPKHRKGLVMGIVMLSFAFSHLGGILISKFISVTSAHGEIDAIRSLAIYREGFLKIAIFYLGVFTLFLFCYAFLNRIINQTSAEQLE